ncbi:MAG: RES family NAD+ phosphorylase [Thermomicrobiales bacterium]|nr:RES family NAD+ phosphorylase [Thermomicrobiales bacterium]
MADFHTVEPPLSGIYRLGRSASALFAPPDWSNAIERDTFSGRFDDPRTDLGKEQRFRIIYCASDRRTAFGETLAGLRPPIRLASRLDSVIDEEPLDESYFHATDPADRTRGLIEADWRLKRAIGHTILEPGLRFVDLGAARTLQQLRASFETWAPGARVEDVDQSLVMGPSRQFTQRIARYIYEHQDSRGTPLFAGIRYTSRLDRKWECWAIFADRIRHIPGMPGLPETIFPDDPDLLEVASIFQLTIETVEGAGHYDRP